ncbi:MAG: hypothetical protein A2V69_03565 [Candidatus Portnoybacteria bacterium RBG_13_40_8]|uniref:Uncharacterized protein n=1 Tax=Candidatus Portnoybacteria bacterium RBG_13_40_8 TaxID=1801990 RepID=A0A1G2F1Q9_9BACT|nr:MAG: hypothetical protein A2V69_03565 [Candidatus Portnoybacteria bacterium RBG_13_40_8]OGZ35024.1 MAG: hypothetical protein A2V60_01245 [Candidatus Portnoybacteria bacterium RIFCSPHIGHO2_01_FULL_39_19]
MAYGCEDAKKDIDFFYSGTEGLTPDRVEALNRALYKHMTIRKTPERNISCQKCWDYYQQMIREHYRG